MPELSAAPTAGVRTARRRRRASRDVPTSAQRERAAHRHEPQPQPFGEGERQVGERHAEQQRRRRIRGEDAARELVGPVPRGDGIAHLREKGRVIGRDAVQDVVRRNREVAAEVHRPGARADMEAADQDRAGHDQRHEAEQSHTARRRAVCISPSTCRWRPETGALTPAWIDSSEGCPHPPREGALPAKRAGYAR